MKRLVVTVLLCLTATAAAAWEPPAHWGEVGPVEQWQRLDAHFMRIEGLTGTRNAANTGFDQRAIYAETLRHRSPLPRLTLAEFLALPPVRRSERVDAAAAQLRSVSGFRSRLNDLVMRIQGQQDAAWGNRVGDARVVGDLLGSLQTAVGLDPANPYTWHLLAYFAGVAGDVQRALDALDGLDEALERLPTDALTDVRRRAALDRAWILRDLGYREQAAAALAQSDRLADPDLESRLLHGLLAAQSGDLNAAFRLAGELDGAEVPVFQRDWDSAQFGPSILDPLAWPTKASGHLKAWVLALAWLQDGNLEMARQCFGEFPRDRHYFLGHRFWREAGDIYEVTGRLEAANRAWGLGQMYLPYYPYFIHRPYGLALASLTGRSGTLPLVLGFDRFFLAGSRLAFGAALVSQAAYSEDRQEQLGVASDAADQLETCLRSGLDTPAAALLLGQAQAILGHPFEMLRAAEQAQAALDRPGQDQTCRLMVETLAASARARLRANGQTVPRQWVRPDLPWDPLRDPARMEADLRARWAAHPDDETARRHLAWFLIRHDQPLEGADLAAQPLAHGRELAQEDLILLLEVDRLGNDPRRARGLLADLAAGRADHLRDPRLWVLVGFLCQDNGIPGGRRALEHALQLDPRNQGLARHLELVPQ